MSSPQGAKKGRSYLALSPQISVTNVVMSSQSINNWRNAINAARSAINPRRRSLIDLFEIIKLDGHLESVMDKRRTAITNKKINWLGKSESNKDFIEDNILQAPWFYNLRGHAIDAKSYGFSLIELELGKDGLIHEAELLPRQNTFPEYKFYAFSTGTANPSPESGAYFEDDPRYNATTLFVGGKKDYGKLMTVAQYVIYKRGGFGDWAQFAELFGMPFRVGEYDPYDDETRRKLYEGLEKMGGAGFAVIPSGSKLTFHDTNHSGKAEVFQMLIKECNAEISKAYLGGTMTTDDGSSRSQSEVHQDGENEIHISDMIEQEYLLNWKLKPKLIALGYPLTDGRFIYPETNKLPLDKLIDMVTKAARLVDIDEEYIYKTFGVERPSPGSRPVRITSAPAPGQDAQEEDPTDVDPVEEKKPSPAKKKSKVTGRKELKAFYGMHGHSPVLKLSAEVSPAYESILERIAREIHTGKLIAGNIDPELFTYTRDQLMKAVTDGYGGSFTDYDPATPDFEMLVNLNKNVQVFSAFKTHKQLRQATDLLTDSNGKIKPWAQFRNDITELNDQYNINYLQAEYTTAVASAQMASRWVDIERDADILPMLTFRTTEGDNVCPICSAYNGISKPVTDPFWSTYYPPLHFHCNCDVDQSDDASETNTEGRVLPSLKPMFENNVGKSGAIFPKSHPYFDVSAAEKKLISQFLSLHINEAEQLKKSYDEYNSYSKSYLKEGFDKKTGGYIVRHVKHTGIEKTDNLITSRILMGRGDKIQLLPAPGIDKSADALINNVPWEFKKLGNAKNVSGAIRFAIRTGKKQSENVLIRIDQQAAPDLIARGLKSAVALDTKQQFKQVEIIWPGDLSQRSVFTRQEIEQLSMEDLSKRIKSE